MVENPSKGKQKKAAGGRGGGGRRSGGDAASEPAGTQPSTGTRSAGAPPVSDSSDEDEEWTEEEGAIRIGGVVVPPAPPPHCSQEASGPRPIITHIVNENFKSYAGRVILGPFHKSFTSIIGPNGSGKSNVIDSMLFVFGYRATKIRSKKISVLLHKSENHQNVRSCTVEVHFIKINDLPGDDYEKIPGSKLVIARTAFADNTSFYTINGKRSQFKDVANILRSHGIDLVHNRFLILQGEVEQIAMMKPKAQTEHDTGMLEYLEDIIGTTRYKKPIHKLGTKLEQLTEERLERLNRMKVAEKERDTLKEPMSEAIEFLTIENKKTVVQNSRYQKQIFDLENKLKALEKEKEEHDSKMEELKEKLKEAHEKRTKKEKEMNVKHKEIESLRAQKEKLSEAFRLIENRATRLKEEISQTNKRRKKAIEAKKQEEAKIIELEALPAKNSKEIEELTLVEKKLVPERERQQTVVEEAVVNLQSETKELQDSKDNLSDQLIGLKRDKDEAKSKYDIAKAELDLYLSNEQKEIAKLDKLKENLQKTVEQLKKRKVELADLDLKVSAGEQQLEAARTELNSIKAKEPKALQELHRLRATLDEKKSSMQARTSRSKVLDFIMRQKQEGHLPGVFGRLGDLGGIDAKYDVAISTACGALDHIVVDTIQTGMACVNALKRNDVGRANFIALEKQEHLRNVYRRPIKTPENVPRLFDLITVEDDRVRPAFYFALRDTLVADDLQQSIRVAYGATRFRVVTLTGEIIETSGTMSGGGNQVMRGRMGRSVAIATSDQLNTSSGGNVNIGSMEKRVAELQETISGYHRRQAQLEDTVATLSRNIERWKMDCESFKFEIEGLGSQEPVLKQQVHDQEAVVKASAPDPKEVSKMKSKLSELKEVFDRKSRVSDKTESDVADLTNKIEKIIGTKLKESQNKLDAITKKLDKVRAEITKLKVGINTSERNLKKSKDRVESLTVEIKEAETALKKADSESQSHEKEGHELNEKVEKISNEILISSQFIDGLRSEISVLVKEENKFNTSKIHEDQNIDSLAKGIQEIKSGIPHLKKKLAALKLHEIPDLRERGEEVTPPMELVQLTPPMLEEIDLEKLLYKITNYDETLKGMKPNLKVIADYEEKAQLLKKRCSELDEATQKRNEMRKAHDELRKCRLNEFMVGFTLISNKLKEMYQMITLGGDAEFELIDSLDPFSEGVVFSVRPPKKSWKEISNLSGGEKTLSSLALVFALHYYRPSPLYVMDEIDAALDFKNVSIVGNYIKERTKNAQFIIISLRSNMFELADVLVGVYKTYNCTQSVTITPSLYSTTPPEKVPDADETPPSSKVLKTK